MFFSRKRNYGGRLHKSVTLWYVLTRLVLRFGTFGATYNTRRALPAKLLQTKKVQLISGLHFGRRAEGQQTGYLHVRAVVRQIYRTTVVGHSIIWHAGDTVKVLVLFWQWLCERRKVADRQGRTVDITLRLHHLVDRCTLRLVTVRTWRLPVKPKHLLEFLVSANCSTVSRTWIREPGPASACSSSGEITTEPMPEHEQVRSAVIWPIPSGVFQKGERDIRVDGILRVDTSHSFVLKDSLFPMRQSRAVATLVF